MFTRIKSMFLKDPNIIKLPLDMNLKDLKSTLRDFEVSTEESNWEETEDYVFEKKEYKIIAHIQDGHAKGYIHNTEIYRESNAHLTKKLNTFLDYYGKDNELNFLIDNGFGFIYKSEDGTKRAAYSYACDIFSVSYFYLNRKENME